VSDLRNNVDMPTEFLISDKFIVDGKLILAGTVIKGNINKGQLLQLGPDVKGNFRAVEIVDIRCVRVAVKYAKCGQTCTLHIKPLNYCKEWLEK
jgi:GTPase